MHTYYLTVTIWGYEKFELHNTFRNVMIINREASVKRSTQRIKRFICDLNEKNGAYHTIIFPVSQAFLCKRMTINSERNSCYYSTEQSLLEADIPSASEVIPAFYGTQEVLMSTVFTRARHCTLPWLRWNQDILATYFSNIHATLSSHLHLVLPSVLFLSSMNFQPSHSDVHSVQSC
jgi:hypothetical protein